MRYAYPRPKSGSVSEETGRALKLVPDVEKNECSAEHGDVLEEVDLL